MLVVFTDLDGTLLDRDTYTFDPAIPSLERLRTIQARLVLLSSKTRAEVEIWRTELNLHDPFSVENGGAVLAERNNPSLIGNIVKTPEGYEVVEIGIPYQDLVTALGEAAAESGCSVRGFASMSVQEISLCCGMDVEHARMAKMRSYDEPFQLLQGDPDTLETEIMRRGLRLTKGGRFFHLTGPHDKADAVRLLVKAYERLGHLRTIGLGDGLNDSEFLNLVEHPVILDSPAADELRKRVPRAQVFASGPRGWNAAVLQILDREPYL